MIVDSSALLAILLEEVDQQRFISAFEKDFARRMSGASLVELTITVDRRKDRNRLVLMEELLAALQVSIEPITLEQIDWARKAHLAYGRGRHAAGLNFGDCFSYALAKVTGEPLLFKGEDFALTDIPAVV